jgi:hypothetical protein
MAPRRKKRPNQSRLASMSDEVRGVEAEDTEPPPGDPEVKPTGQLAGDAKARADFNRRFPDAAKINIDSSGIQPRGRAASYSAAGAKSFAEKFPDAMKIRLL